MDQFRQLMGGNPLQTSHDWRQVQSAPDFFVQRFLPLPLAVLKFCDGRIMEKLRLFAVAGVTTPPVELSRYEAYGV